MNIKEFLLKQIYDIKKKGFKELFKPVSYKKTAKGELTGINWEKLKTNKSTTPIKKNIMFMWKNR